MYLIEWSYVKCGQNQSAPVNEFLHALFVPVERLILIISQRSPSLPVDAPDQVSDLRPVILQLLWLPLWLSRDLPNQRHPNQSIVDEEINI